MKVEILDDGLIIVPETQFEEKMLVKMYCRKDDKCFTAFIKCGTTPADVIGLKIPNTGE